MKHATTEVPAPVRTPLLPMCAVSVLLSVPLAITPASAQDAHTLPRLLSATVTTSAMNVQSGGIAALDVTVDESGSVSSADMVQDVSPYGAMLQESVRGWRFEPALDRDRAVRSRVLVLGFFRPPELAVIAPARPKYKDTAAPPELPWPTAVTVPPYPPNALGSGKVILEVDVSEEGKATGARVLSTASPFDSAAADAAKAWTFRPASRHNRPAATRAYFVFSFVGTTR